MKKIVTILSYLNWISVPLFLLVVTWFAFPYSKWVAAFFFGLAAIMTVAMIHYSSPKFSRSKRPGNGKPLGEPIIDIVILGTSVPELQAVDGYWHPILLAGVAMLLLDIALYIIMWMTKRFGGRVQDA